MNATINTITDAQASSIMSELYSGSFSKERLANAVCDAFGKMDIDVYEDWNTYLEVDRIVYLKPVGCDSVLRISEYPNRFAVKVLEHLPNVYGRIEPRLYERVRF